MQAELQKVAMAVLKVALILGLVLGLSRADDELVPPSPCPLENARYLPIYDLENTTYNVLGYEEVFNSFLKDGVHSFKDIETKTFGDMYYGDYPVFVVYQPDENVPELHGYHYPHPWGLRMIYDTARFDDEMYAEYQPFRDYLNSPIDKEGYTPSAALQIYPEFENMKLTKVVQDPNEEKVTTGFALLFLLPKKESLKPNNFEQRYSVFEQFYYNGSEICKYTARDVELLQEDGVYEDDYVPLLTVYSHYDEIPGATKGQNVVDLDQVNEYYSKTGFYKFDNYLAEFRPYDEFPILMVFQPDERVPELHGYYFDGGILSLVSYMNENTDLVDEYRPFFEYFEREPDLDGFTPDAARFDYPYFFDYKLTKFTHGDNVAEQFATLFLAPKRYRPASFLEKYKVIEDYGIGDKYIVEYVVDQQ